MRTIILGLLLGVASVSYAQVDYFPPVNGEWETRNPSELGFCPDSIASLFDYLENTDTKAFLLIQDGKIVLEQYATDFDQQSNWYWASAGKTLTAFLLGLAQEQGFLNLEDPSSQFLGEGWTSLPPENEATIRLIHQLTMTTGLNDQGDVFCTDPQCLTYMADPGTRWSYHNAPYTLLTEVIASASGMSYNEFTRTQLYNRIGMQGAWLPNGYNNVHWSTPRSMARFGLLIANEGIWDGDTILSDREYFREMIEPSQNLNQSYGYLWWLNGQPSFMLPGSQLVFSGSLVPEAPEDAFFALGKNAQMLAIMPAQGRVLVRMGNDPGTDLISIEYARNLFQRIENLECTTSANQTQHVNPNIKTYPNPVRDFMNWECPEKIHTMEIWDTQGRRILHQKVNAQQGQCSVQHLPKGMYFLRAVGVTTPYQSIIYVD